VLLDGAHGVVDLGPDVFGLGEVEQVVEAGGGRQVEQALGVVSGGIVEPGAAPRGGGGGFELGALDGEPGLGEAQENEAEDGRGVFLSL